MWKSAHRVLRDIRHRRCHFPERNGRSGISKYCPIASSDSNSSSNNSSRRRNGDDQKQQVVEGWESVVQSHFQCDDASRSGSGSGREFGSFEQPFLQAVRFGSSGLRNLPHSPTQRDRITERVGINAHQGWRGDSSTLLRTGVASGGLHLWKSGDILRVFSTKSTSDSDDVQRSSSSRPEDNKKRAEPATGEGDLPFKAAAAGRPKSIEDFQHEEIVGPTVERDMSDAANQLRNSLNSLTTFMADLRNGFVLLGGVQFLAAVWSAAFHDVGFIHGLPQNLAFVVSFALAYLLRYYASAMVFFRRVEERSRMKVLTLSLQMAKMLSLFFYRSDFVVKAMAFGSLFALIIDIWQSHFSG